LDLNLLNFERKNNNGIAFSKEFGIVVGAKKYMLSN